MVTVEATPTPSQPERTPVGQGGSTEMGLGGWAVIGAGVALAALGVGIAFVLAVRATRRRDFEGLAEDPVSEVEFTPQGAVARQAEDDGGQRPDEHG